MVQNRICRFGLGAAAAAVVAAVSACGQGASNAQPPASDTAATSASTPTSSVTSATDSATPSVTQAPNTSNGGAAAPGQDDGLCKAADLRLSLGHGEGAAGTAYHPLVFTNVSDRSCVIQGFPGVSYVGGDDGHQVGPPAERDGTKGPAITLDKGQSAFATVGFVNVGNYDAATCQPQPVRGLRVYPPQETASLYIGMSTTGCGSDRIPGHQLTVKTIEKGTGD